MHSKMRAAQCSFVPELNVLLDVPVVEKALSVFAPEFSALTGASA